MKTYQLYINGQYVDPAKGEWFDSIDPYRGKPWAKIPRASKADADAAVKAAMARAKASGKLLIIDLGGNWCPDCRVLAGTMALPQVKAFIGKHYELVMVDVGRFDRNLQIPGRYGIARPEGVPALLIIDPKTNRLLNPGKTSALSNARAMTPQALADWLASWTK